MRLEAFFCTDAVLLVERRLAVACRAAVLKLQPGADAIDNREFGLLSCVTRRALN